jgi:hypothetical protein
MARLRGWDWTKRGSGIAFPSAIFSFAPSGPVDPLNLITHGLRRGLHSFAAFAAPSKEQLDHAHIYSRHAHSLF